MNFLSDIFPGPLIVLPLFIAIVLIALLMVRYKLLVFLIIFTIPIRNVSLMGVPGANLRPGDLLILLGAGVVICQMLTGRITVHFTKLDGLLMLFVLLCFISLVWSPDIEVGLGKAGKFLRNLALYGVLVTWLRLGYQRVYKYIIAGMILSFSYLLCLLLYAVVGGQLDINVLRYAERFTSASLNAWRSADASQATFSGSINSLALWTATVIILWFGTALWMGRGWKRRGLFWGVAIVLFLLVIATLSRSVWLGLMAGGGLCIVKMKHRIRVSPLALASVMVLIITIVFVLESQGLWQIVTGRFLSIRNTAEDAAILGRFEMWSDASNLIKANPLLGIGSQFGCFHNVYLQMLVELGVFGFMLFLCIFGTAIGMLRRSMKLCANGKTYVLVVSLMGGVMFYLVTGLTMADFTEMEIWIILAMISALPYLQSQSRQHDVSGASCRLR
jgi:O-antigen ligase